MISLKNISKSYKDVKALREFTYDFDCGLYAILGPNGSGKSTLMNIMTGNLSKDNGTISFAFDQKENGKDLRDIYIGYVPQYPGMYPHFTVYEMLSYASILKGISNNREQIEKLINTFDLSEYRGKKIRALSGGTKQRLAIAHAFIGNPKLVILDEPTAGLDPMQRIKFKNFVSDQAHAMTIVVSTHIVSDVEDIADNVIFLKKGEIVESGTVKSVVSKLEGHCWLLDTGYDEPYDGFVRVNGDERRVISEVRPTKTAKTTEPTLDDCYIRIFGAEM